MQYGSSQIALAYDSCNFENFRNITRAHKSRNALAFIRFPIHIAFYLDKYMFMCFKIPSDSESERNTCNGDTMF